MKYRTDLAIDSNFNPNCKIDGLIKEQLTIEDIEISRIEIQTLDCAKILNRSPGKYISLEHQFLFKPEKEQQTTQILTDELKSQIGTTKNALVIGLGNDSISPDALGPQTAKKIIATRHIKNSLEKSLNLTNLTSVSVITPGVLGQTGIETAEIIKTIANLTKPDVIIVIDALASRTVDRIGTTIQITDSGISPGSGVNNNQIEISEKLLKTKVIAIGVPTMVDLSNLISKTHISNNQSNLMVTPKDINKTIIQSSKIIATAINNVLLPNLTPKELEILVG